ncbi:MAG: TcpQ domain-containing protein [Gluconobacter cerinus]|uniref:toxin co-regulated pilus biosynthesis Q family protein n=1 Tax=Gluconobacter cerinus TaxID=38307 RepID=UPI0039E90AE9
MTRRPYAPIAASVLAFLSACTEVPPSQTSHVSGANFRDTSALTVFIADILANSLDAGRTVVRLAPYSGPDDAHAQTLLTDTLRERGFALSPQGMPYPGAQTVRYAVSPLGTDLLVELDVEDAIATCLYGHDADGALRRKGSCSLRSGAALSLHIPTQEILVPAPEKPKVAQSAPQAGPVQLAPHTPNDAKTVGAQPVEATPRAVITAAPPSPPVHLQPPAEVWTLIEGQPIRDQMIAWGDRAGWRVIWPEGMNWMVPVTTGFTGPFRHDDGHGGDDGVMSQVIHALSAQGKTISLQLFTVNHVALVTNTGIQQ